ncbi:uncharacterized protein BO97DRAFT_349753, partial [Aspergillus homomorphus CBS 101889]
AGAQKHNCFVIRAQPITGTSTSTDTESQYQRHKDADFIEPFPLRAYGNWVQEKQEVKTRLSWRSLEEPGTFFSHQDTADWHYYVYSQQQPPCPNSRGGVGAADAERLPLIALAARCLEKQVRGDVVVVRFSAIEVDNYEEEFSANELVRTVGNYRTVRDAKAEHERRERERIAAKFGLN